MDFTGSTAPDPVWQIDDAPVPYPDALAHMQTQVAAIRAGGPERVWLLEHPPLYTAGSSARPDDLTGTQNLPVFDAGRGGQWTYHGPGQRVAYVMLDLEKPHGTVPQRDLHLYVEGLEAWLILALDQFNIRGERRAGRVGIWVADRAAGTEKKIAAIGVRITRWVSWHGVSFNVDPHHSLRHYRTRRDQPARPGHTSHHGGRRPGSEIRLAENLQHVNRPKARMTETHFYQPEAGHRLPHDPLKAIVAPRPIGWISSISPDGVVNLAPYSFFNMVCEQPPMLMFSSYGYKDSVRNIEATGEFVANLAGRAQAEAMNLTCAPVPPDVNEMDLAGLTPAPSTLIKPPRVAAAPAALECKLVRLERLRGLDGAQASNWLVLGQIVGIHIRPEYLVDGRFDTLAAKPLGRCGYRGDYVVVDRFLEMFRPEFDQAAGVWLAPPVAS
jgi:lipoate-protein ligase B